MSNSKTQQLIEINEKIKNLKAVKCKITHEQVQIDGKTNLPISQNIGEKIYERIGFCSKELREERISCSHSTASDKLHDALDLLDTESTKIIDLKNNLMDTVFQIHHLDHQKSDAEKHLAILTEERAEKTNDVPDSDINLAKKQIEIIENKHDEYVDKIAEIRDKIIVEIEQETNLKIAI